MKPLFRGLYTALLTPFTEQGLINENMLRRLLQRQIDAHVDGIVVLGSTGETPTLKSYEKRAVITIAREMTSGKVPLVVGTGTYSTADTIDATLEAEKLGADGVLIIAPYYNRPSQEGFYQHFKAISEAVSLPILAYNHLGRTGQNMQIDTIARIAELPNLCGLKEVSASMNQMSDIFEYYGKKRANFSVLTGDDAMILPYTLMGGDGVIAVASNLIPESMRHFTHAALDGNLEVARRYHHALMPLFRALCMDTNPIPLKAAMHLSGFDVGGYRLPLCPLSLQHRELMSKILAENSLVQDELSAQLPSAS
jgi:4-hydroxy-tetrahydrodipicolinate synthase